MIKQDSRRLHSGFTIVELLIVIVVIAILAAISIVSYRGIQSRAVASKQSADMATLVQAIHVARINTDKSLGQVSGDWYSIGYCTRVDANPEGTEPRDLPRTHPCWVRYYALLDNIGQAAEMDLSALRSGDARGNPYMFDENEGEGGDDCLVDSEVRYFIGAGVYHSAGPAIPKYYGTC